MVDRVTYESPDRGSINYRKVPGWEGGCGVRYSLAVEMIIRGRQIRLCNWNSQLRVKTTAKRATGVSEGRLSDGMILLVAETGDVD